MAGDLLERVSERVYRIRDRYVNLYVIDAGPIALVDTGTRKAEPLVRSALRELGKEVQDVRIVLLTHHHLDHMGTAGVWKRKAGASIAVHGDDADVVAGKERRRGMGVGVEGKVLVLFAGIFARLARPEFVPPDRILGGEEEFDLLGLRARTLHVPGHTRGSLAFQLPSEDVLLAGDAVNGRRGVASPPWFVEDPEAALVSFRRLLALRTGILCPGHGNPVRASPP